MVIKLQVFLIINEIKIVQMVNVIIGIIAGFLGGGTLSYFMWDKALRSRKRKIVREAEAEGEVIRKDKMLQAKEKFLQLKSEHEKQVNERNQRVVALENKLKQRETLQQQQRNDLQRDIKNFETERREVELIRENLTAQLALVEQKSEELEKLHRQQVDKLEQVSGMSAEEAKAQMIESLKEEAKSEAMSYVNEIMEEAKQTASKEAKKVVVKTIQRVATETAIENAVTTFHIESDEIKGRIIGREGRNIRALEAATGVEIIVDDTPEAIVLSAFDPVRREIARLALHQLVTDGRIHPARIEEVVQKVQKQVEEEVIETGKRTAIDLGIHGLHP
jgi:ribonucrease Y